MKYQMEMSEGEYIATLNLVERIVGKVCETAIAMERLRVERASAFKHVEHEHVEHEHVEDNDEVAPRPFQGRGVKRWRPLNADAPAASSTVVVPLREKDAPTGADVGRGEVGAIKAPSETPLPTTAVSVDKKKLHRGMVAFDHLVDAWRTNFGVEGAEQPDRAETMRSLANSPKSFAVLAYVQSVGGLTHAVDKASYFMPDGWKSEEERQKLVLDFAGNMTQVSSILFPDLSDLYEYRDIFKKREED